MPAKQNKFAPNNHRYHRSKRGQSPDIAGRRLAKRKKLMKLEKEFDHETDKYIRDSLSK